MKKTIFAVLVVLLMINTTSQAQSDVSKITFKGVVDSAYNGTYLVLYNKITGDHDSVQVQNGKFSISVPFKGPGRYMFYSKYELKKKGGYSPYGILVINPGDVILKADLENFAKTTVQNAPENDLYNSFVSAGMPAKLTINQKMMEKFGDEVMKNLKPANPQYAEVLKYFDELNAENNKVEMARLKTFIKENSNSFTAMYLLNNMAGSMPANTIEELYAALSKTYKQSTYAQNIVKSIDALKITAVGKPAPDFEQTDTLGKMVRLSDFKGKYVLLDFWASWCIPCREENPNVLKAYNRFHEKGFTVLGISLDQPGQKKAWMDAIKQDKLNWTQVSDLRFWNNSVAVLYGIRSVPQNFLLDRDGKIIASNIKGEELTKKLIEVLGKL